MYDENVNKLRQRTMEGEFFNLVNLILCLIVVYMVLHLIVSTPIGSYSFKSAIRLLALVCCSAILIAGAIFMANEMRFSRSGIVTNAEISDHETIIKQTLAQNTEVEYKVRYSFNDANNISYTGEAFVDKYTWEMSQLNPNKKLKVVYINDEPSINRNLKQSQFSQALAMLIIGFAGLLTSLLIKTRGSVYSYKPYKVEEVLASYGSHFRKNTESQQP